MHLSELCQVTHMLNIIQIAECVYTVLEKVKNNSFLFAQGKYQQQKNV